MNNETLENLILIAKKAAIEASKVQLNYFGFDKNKKIEEKSNEFDLVTIADKEAEKVIISTIKKNYPEHNFLGEESGTENLNSEYTWVIDPIDGTTNYTHNFPHFAVSIGLLKNNERVLGVVYDVCKDEMFWGVKGKGAFLNETPIKVSNTKKLSKSLLATGFPTKRADILDLNLKYFKEFMQKCQAIRRPGAASLDLCYVACGRLDGFWEMGLSPWDVVAGAFIIEEAGGKAINFNSNELDIHEKSIIAGNPNMVDEIQNIIKFVVK